MNNEQELYNTRLLQAEQTLSDARDIRDLGSKPKYILRRAYYSMIYGLLSLFDKDDIEIDSSDHADIISLFNERYIMTGESDSNHYKLIRDIYEINENSDQVEKIDSYLIGPSLAESTISGAAHFLEFVRSRLSTIH
jgi:uncharacterized protein (UPF0332 family)